jgi:hypothetical protein
MSPAGIVTTNLTLTTARRAIDTDLGNLSLVHATTDWAPLQVDRERWRGLLEYNGLPPDLIERALAQDAG